MLLAIAYGTILNFVSAKGRDDCNWDLLSTIIHAIIRAAIRIITMKEIIIIIVDFLKTGNGENLIPNYKG